MGNSLYQSLENEEIKVDLYPLSYPSPSLLSCPVFVVSFVSISSSLSYPLLCYARLCTSLRIQLIISLLFSTVINRRLYSL